jgi:hypothetical protein
MRPSYYSYLLRIWQPENRQSAQWFASLEAPSSHEMIYFQNIEDLLVFLRSHSNNPINNPETIQKQDLEEA